jgi:TetR/AcrR family transcriptional regulator, transcriptional repressor for nem operon
MEPNVWAVLDRSDNNSYLTLMARPKSFDDDAVLDRALQLFHERGFEGTSMSDLEAHLGLGRQSLYNTFGDKRELYLKALDRYQRQENDRMIAMLEAPDAGLDAVERWLAANAAAVTARGAPAGCFTVNSIIERPDDAPTAARCTRGRECLTAAIRAALSRAQAKGEIPAERDLDGLVGLLVAHVYGLAVLARAGATERELRAASEALMEVVR